MEKGPCLLEVLMQAFMAAFEQMEKQPCLLDLLMQAFMAAVE